MDSIIFRRGTRKGCGCMRGGRSLEGQIANNEKSLRTLNAQLTNARYAKLTNKIRASRNKIQVRLNGLRTQKVAANKAAANAKLAANKAVANAQAAANQAAANAAKAATNAVNAAKSEGVLSKVMTALTPASTAPKNNAAVNTASNKAKKLNELAKNANALAQKLRNIAMTTGGKRTRRRRTHRK